MNKAFYIVIYIFLFFLASCNSGKHARQMSHVRQSLNYVEQHIKDNPDSSHVILGKLFKYINSLSTSERMKYYLLDTECKNKMYIPLLSDSIMLNVAEYYNNKGTTKEKIRSCYMLGCVYRDMGETPKALEYLNDAISMFDTKDINCDYSLLSRIYAQKAGIFKQQNIQKESFIAFRNAEKYALKCKDTLAAINYYNQQTSYYISIGNKDSAAYISVHSYEMFKKHGYDLYAPRALAYAISKYIDDGNMKLAKKYLDIYMSDSSMYEKNGILNNANVFALFYLAEFSFHNNEISKAKKYYTELLARSQNLNQKQGAYEGLYKVYKKNGETDSALKYSEKLVYAEDSAYKETMAKDIQQIESAYKYQNSKKIINNQQEEIYKNKIYLLLYLLVFIIVCVLFYELYIIKKRKDQEQINYLNSKYELTYEKLKASKYKLNLLEKLSSHDKKKLKEKQDDIKLLNAEIAELRKMKRKLEITDNQDVSNSEIIKLLHSSAYRRIPLSDEQWRSLYKFMECEYPAFLSNLQELGITKKNDIYLCILTKLRFKLNDISFFFDKSPSALSNWRVRLLKQVFHIDGSTHNFDEKIREL